MQRRSVSNIGTTTGWEDIPFSNIDQSDHLALIHSTLVCLGSVAKRLVIVHDDDSQSEYRLTP